MISNVKLKAYDDLQNRLNTKKECYIGCVGWHSNNRRKKNEEKYLARE